MWHFSLFFYIFTQIPQLISCKTYLLHYYILILIFISNVSKVNSDCLHSLITNLLHQSQSASIFNPRRYKLQFQLEAHIFTINSSSSMWPKTKMNLRTVNKLRSMTTAIALWHRILTTKFSFVIKIPVNNTRFMDAFRSSSIKPTYSTSISS